MTEFDMIARYFRPLTSGDALQDDAAVLSIPHGYELVITSDTLNAGTHFLETESAQNIAHKALRANLSDLAAMGASPLCYQLNLAFPEKPSEAWLSRFTSALATDQAEFGIYCSGGDTTSILGPYLSISITTLGLVPVGKALRRSGARGGDLVMVTGPVGDAYLGLKSLHKALDYPEAIARYRRPMPRLQSAELRDYIHAAADISDGLLADLTHICTASGLGAKIHLSQFTFSPEIQDAMTKDIITPAQAIIGGDDYELTLAVPPENEAAVRAVFPDAMTVGHFSAGAGVTVFNHNKTPIKFESQGWSHF